MAGVRFARAETLLAPGETEAAAREAAESFRRQRQPVDAGRAAIIAGRALAEADPAAAVRMLEAAREELARCGADGFRGEAERELARLGAPAGDGSVEALTARQPEIAELVATGMTNREIAAKLVVSPMTIDRHLARIFATLGIGSRAPVGDAG